MTEGFDPNAQVIIPARRDSKRFPHKNKALLGGIPLISHSINYALEEGVSPSQIWVNSDDEEILEMASNQKVQIYSRNRELAGDLIPTVSVLMDQIEFFEENQIACDSLILLQVTNPFRPKLKLKSIFNEFKASGRSSLCTFSPLNKKFGKIEQHKFIPVNYEPGQRMQDLEPLFFENGCIYISSKELIKAGTIIGEDAYPFILEDLIYTIDIDEKSDLLLAEALMKSNHE